MEYCSKLSNNITHRKFCADLRILLLCSCFVATASDCVHSSERSELVREKFGPKISTRVNQLRRVFFKFYDLNRNRDSYCHKMESTYFTYYHICILGFSYFTDLNVSGHTLTINGPYFYLNPFQTLHSLDTAMRAPANRLVLSKENSIISDWCHGIRELYHC